MDQDDINKIMKMKLDYQQIPVPDETKRRIQAGIENARQEERKKKMIKLTKRTGMTAAAAMLTLTVLTNISPVTANAMEQIPVVGALAKVVTFRTYEDTNHNYAAKIDVPKVSLDGQDHTAVNKTIEDYANELIAKYEKELAADAGKDGHYSVSSSYEVVTDSDRYLSLRIHTTVAMASGADSTKIFTIDKTTGEIVSLKDLFKDRPEVMEIVSSNIKSQMEEQMAADDSKAYFYNSPEEAVDDFTGITGTENFYFNQDGELVIVFDEYTVAPGYMGIVEFVIPKEVTGEL